MLIFQFTLSSSLHLQPMRLLTFTYSFSYLLGPSEQDVQPSENVPMLMIVTSSLLLLLVVVLVVVVVVVVVVFVVVLL